MHCVDVFLLAFAFHFSDYCVYSLLSSALRTLPYSHCEHKVEKKNRILFAPCYRSNTGFINNDSLHSAVPFPKISHTHFSYFKCKRGVMWCVEDIRCMMWNSTACICFTSFGNIEKWDGLHILFYYFNPPLSRCCCWCWTLSFVNGLWKKLK